MDQLGERQHGNGLSEGTTYAYEIQGHRPVYMYTLTNNGPGGRTKNTREEYNIVGRKAVKELTTEDCQGGWGVNPPCYCFYNISNDAVTPIFEAVNKRRNSGCGLEGKRQW